MKRTLFIYFFVLLSLAGFSQSVSCDLFLSNAHFEDLSGTLIDATTISYNQVVKIKVTIGNGNPSTAAPAGHYKVRIGLGSGMLLNPGFDFTTAGLSTYFTWSYDLSGSQPQIVGTSTATNLPADFTGVANFNLIAATAGVSTASFNFLIANPVGTTTPLSDPDFTNNLAANGYTVASAISFSTVTQNVSCNGANDGKITINAAGGVPPYTITIVNTATSASAFNAIGIFTGLASGNYNITVADGFGNSNTGTTAISEPAAVTLSVVATNISCNGAANGTINVSNVTGETFTIKKDGTGADLSAQSAFAPGTYIITASTANGNVNGFCTKDTTVTVTEPIKVTLSVVATNVSCNGAANGTITATASAGATITVDNVAFVAGTQYSPGTYHVVASAQDGNMGGFCTKDTTVTITQPNPVTLSVVKTNVSCNGAGNGTISVTNVAGETYTIKKDASGADLSSQANFGPGSYTITASAPGGNTGQTCTKDSTVIISEPSPVTLSVVKTNVSCNGGVDGTIIASASNLATITVEGQTYNPSAYYAPGIYHVVATAAGGNTGQFCTKDTIVIVVEPIKVTLSVVATNVSCNGAGDGTIAVSNVSTGATITIKKNGVGSNLSGQANFGAGTYVVSATAPGGNTGQTCSKDTTVTITEPIKVTLSVVRTNVSCNGSGDGTISISNVSAGTATTIKKDGTGADLSSQTAFGPGTYVITATAAGGNTGQTCTKDTTVIITEPIQVALSVVAANVSCNGSANGTITANGSAGTSITVNNVVYNAGTPYSPGVYHVIASAPNGNGNGFCTKDTTVTITEPTAVTLSVVRTNVSCNGGANGTITATSSSATITVNGQAYNASTPYTPGSYHVVATAAGGNLGQTCTKDTTVFITEPPLVTLSVVAVNVTCNGSANGTITVSNVSGETYTIKKDGAGPDLSTQTNFAPGTYVVTASAQNGNMNGNCTKDTTVTISQPTVLLQSFVSKTNNACHGGNNGEIKVAASGGTPGYTFTIAGPTVNTTGATSGMFTGLTAGTYSITVTDGNGCTAIVNNITITEPSGTTPDIILSVADYTDNFFPANASEVTLIYQVTEIGGNPALTDLLRISKQNNYNFSLPLISSITVGSGSNATTYPLDNSRWTADNSDLIFFNVSINNGMQIDCGKSVYLAVKLTRGTPNKSVFTLTSVMKNVTNETQTGNNSTTIVLVGQ